jgi:peptidoglycan/LPS O-acetylase OafA/YrhL
LCYVVELESPLLTGYDDLSYEPTYMLSHCRYDSILFGCVAALLIQKRIKVYQWLYNNIWVFSLAIGILLICLISRGDFFRNSFRYSLQGLALMFIVPAIVLSSGFIRLNQILSSKWLVQIGKMSYSLYVMHWIGIMLAGDLYPKRPMMYLDVIKPWPWYLVAVPVTVVLTFLSYYAVEKNFIKLRTKFGSIVKQ